ncbi:hypothetical protein C8Q78DRAFT_1084043 [Trametes maxima]|nr:hypothetical protein C8Q78DRAFT_1084043 [Trametes maxima]
MSVLAHLYANAPKYQAILQEWMHECVESEPPFGQLQSFTDPARAVDHTEIVEQQAGRTLVLIHRRPDTTTPPEELVLRVQGFLVDASLPPLRRDQIPTNTHRLIDLKQSVTITGLGVQPFDDAAAAVLAVYHQFSAHLKGHHLRTWQPERANTYISLTFGNRYLTAAKFSDNEPHADLSEVVDPFNVLQPHLSSQVHLQENVVEYWERNTQPNKTRRIKPDAIMCGAMVELQIAFTVAKLGRHDYIFLPKLRAICILNRVVHADYNASIIKHLSTRNVSPLRKVKRKVGYDSDDKENASMMDLPQQRLKCLTLGDGVV